MSTYSEKLRDPRWQKKRLEILERDKWTCQGCGETSKELQVHHTVYENGKKPWEHDSDGLKTLCVDCHQMSTQAVRTFREAISYMRPKQAKALSSYLKLATESILRTLEPGFEGDLMAKETLALAQVIMSRIELVRELTCLNIVNKDAADSAERHVLDYSFP